MLKTTASGFVVILALSGAGFLDGGGSSAQAHDVGSTRAYAIASILDAMGYHVPIYDLEADERLIERTNFD